MKIIKTDHAPAAIGPYSQAVVHNNILYISGQIPFDPTTMTCATGGIEGQTKQSLENVKAIIEKAGASLENTLRVGIFLKDMNQFDQMNQVYATYFTKHKPARACVEVARLPKDVLVEIEAIVAL